MNTGNNHSNEDKLLKELFSKHTLETTSPDFTDNLMAKIELLESAKANKLASKPSTEYDFKKPLKIYFGAMGAIALLVIILASFGNSSTVAAQPSTNHYYNFINRMTDGIDAKFLPSSLQIQELFTSTYMQYTTIILLVVMFYVLIESKVLRKSSK